MKNKLLALFLLSSLSAFATDSITLEDYDYVVSGNTSVTAPGDYLNAFWGTFSGDVFTPISGTGVNSGYVGLGGDDSLINYAATTNGAITAGTQLYLGIFDIDQADAFSTVTALTPKIILTDATWLAPTFNTSPGAVSFNYTQNTSAVVGSYSFGTGGVQTLTLTAVPEPSSFAALAGFAVLGLAASRRRRA